MFWKAIGRWKRWLLDEDKEPRRALRAAQPDVIVHYWDGSAPEGRCLRDINENGAYIYTPERWYPGTIIRIILQGYQRTVQEDGGTAPSASTCIAAQVVRHGPDGVAVEFSFPNKRERKIFQQFLAGILA